MNHIRLDRLSIINFKGIEKLQITFDPRSQNIWGENGTGKTTIADAFPWLLFGKNSLGEADFGIKRLDKDGKKIDNTEVEVEGVIDFNGRKITLRHRFVEVWSKIKGSEERTLTGNTHEYFVDNAPYKLAEYKAFINKLVDETIFPMITNPLHFNRLPWQKRRELLLSISGDISNADLAAAHPEFKELIAQLNNKTLSKYKQEVLANKKLCKEQLEGLPTRIDEVRRGMPKEEDYEAIVAQVQNREESLAEIDADILSVSKAGEKFTQSVRDHQAKVRGLKLDQDGIASKLRDARKTEMAEAGRELTQKRTSLAQTEKYLTDAQNSLDSHEARKASIQRDVDAGREAWKKVNAEKFEMADDATKCPSCHQELPADDLESKRAELKTNFDTDKASRLKRNEVRGSELKKELSQVEQVIEARKQEVEQHQQGYDVLVEAIRELEAAPQEDRLDIEEVTKANPEYIAIGKKIADLEAVAPKEDQQDLSAQRLKQQGIRVEIDELKKKLATKEQRETATTRIEELKAQETTTAREVDKWEKMESLIEKFTKRKIDALTDRINDRFQLVRFKMFNFLQNGGVEETCEVMVDGVPFSDLNTAARINAGLDVINVLSAHYGVHAPIVVDNRESVTALLDTDSQVISLHVHAGAKTLHFAKNPPVPRAQQEALAL